MKSYNLTDKMDFESNPTIQIKDTKLTVQSDAQTVLKVVSIMDEAPDNFTGMMKAYGVIFSSADQKKIEKLKRSAHDFQVLVNAALMIAVGRDPDEREEAGEE